VVELSLGRPRPAMRDYAAGQMFVRISIDQIASIEDFQRVVTSGELSHTPGSSSSPIHHGVSL
jgi:hypothetical protein